MKLLIFALLLVSSVGMAKGQGAVYEVPGFNGAQEAQFPMSFKIEQRGNDVSIDYDLPELLTGAQNRIRAEGSMLSPTLAVLNGPKSHVTCDIPNKLCSIVYKNLDIDLEALQGHLERSGLTQDQIISRLAVAQRFKSDPEGIIRYGQQY